MRPDDDLDPRSTIVDPRGQPARASLDQTCPGCRTLCPAGDPKARRLSGGFGQVHDVCATCGYDFDVLTIPLVGQG